MTSEKESRRGFASIVGGVSPRPGAKISSVEKQKTYVIPSVPRDPDIDEIDLGALSNEEQEREFGPNFYHKKHDEHVKFAQANSKAPAVVLAGGMFGFNEDKVPIMAAKLQCGTCDAQKIYRGMLAMLGDLPDDCLAKKPRLDCPLFKGQLKRQYERMGY